MVAASPNISAFENTEDSVINIITQADAIRAAAEDSTRGRAAAAREIQSLYATVGINSVSRNVDRDETTGLVTTEYSIGYLPGSNGPVSFSDTVPIEDADAESDDGESDAPPSECPAEIIGDMLEEKADFYESIEAQVESPDLNSERLHDMYEDLRDVESSLRNIARRTTVNRAGNLDTRRVNQVCQSVLRANLDEVREIFVRYISEVAIRKRNFVFIEKYDAINAGLQDLQEDFHDVRSDINTFHDQFTCYIEECIQR